MVTQHMRSLIVHGGAGLADPEREASAIAGCEAAAHAGWQVLQQGGSALDAVERAVRVLEDDPEFNAGIGSGLASDGRVYVDAAIMASDLRAGAVGGVPGVPNAISLARRVMERSPHIFLVGDRALDFARAENFALADPQSLVVPRQLLRHQASGGDTVGACAIDESGSFAAATSTGGTPRKHPARVGDSPIVGAGLYADRGAASATGHGESIMRMVLCKAAVDRLARGESAAEVAQRVIEELVARTHNGAGIILIGPNGTPAHFTSTPRMSWAQIVDGNAASGV
jgi:beta-aspartyl-peptidase (threonine type)